MPYGPDRTRRPGSKVAVEDCLRGFRHECEMTNRARVVVAVLFAAFMAGCGGSKGPTDTAPRRRS